MLFEARAKVNLTLEVIGRREDGWHMLDTVFQPLSLTDRIWADRHPAGLVFSCTDRALETEDNLVCRAFRLMKERFGFDGGLRIHLEKHIPSQAGLGGGSGDAAAVLKACNSIFGLGCTREMMAEIGAPLGADVPALIYDGATRGSGNGSLVRPIRTDLVLPFLLLKPPLGLSTPAMYRKLDEMGLAESEAGRSMAAQAALEAGDAAALTQSLFNAFDEAADEEEVILARKLLLDAGAEKAVLCGSGSASFGIFADAESRDRAETVLRKEAPRGWWICAADSVNEER